MTWEAIGAIGETLGSIGVLVSILYLAIQVGNARDAVARSARQARAERNLNYWWNRASPESVRRMAKINTALALQPLPFVAELVERTGITLEEALAENFAHMAVWFGRVESIYNLDQMSPDEVSDFDGGTVFTYQTQPLGRLWYQHSRTQSWMNKSAVKYVDDLLSRAKLSEPAIQFGAT
jgi:hypothetical protein